MSSSVGDWVFVRNPEPLTSPEELPMRPLLTQLLSENWEWKEKAQETTSDLDALSEDSDEWIPTSVPTEIFKDLLDSGKIPDSRVELNEHEVQWVGERDWLYRTRFQLDTSLEKREKAVLVFEGLDTFANVYLNGELILQSENMFREYRVDVTTVLVSGENRLGITFDSALKKGRKEVEKRGKLEVFNGEASRLYVRKAQYHWGWDWGPVIMSAGPWKPIRLEIYSAIIEDVTFSITVSEDLKTAAIECTILTNCEAGTVDLSISKIYPHDTVEVSDPVVQHSEKLVHSRLQNTFTIKDPKLWYPIGYGSQPLYQVIIKLHNGDTILDVCTKTIGLRQVKLIQKPLDNEDGTTFYFEINNIPVFCNGSNWIPADNILTRLTPDLYRAWLSLAVKGNQNMLRVWGGGIYEPDIFYEIADELGILIWQDFMFACGQYPAHNTFLGNVEQEAITQVKRLRTHPSVVLLCGNNEDYQVAEFTKLGWDPTDTNPENWLKTTFPARWIYEKLLPEVVEKYAPGMAYHPGSPWGGEKPTADKTVGDIHQWSVWHGTQEPYQSYPELYGRFVSEFGMQALPSLRTIKSFITNPEEFYPQSRTMDSHNKATGFERRLGAYVLENYRLDNFSLEEYVSQSQRMQADALTSAYKGWRRLWKGPGKEITSGVLVWQLNDCWPCVSWSIVDYYLRPKLAWYAIKRECRPINFSVSRETKEGKEATFAVWGTNMTTEVQVCRATLRLYDIHSGKITKSYDFGELQLGPNRSADSEFLQEAVKAAENLAASVEFSFTASDQNLRCSADWPQPLKYIDFRNRGVNYVIKDETIVLTSEKPTKGVILDVEGDDDSGLEWSDNGFDIMPGETVTVIAKGLNGRKVTVGWYGKE